jgi:uncharacterized membrane protein
MQPPVKFKWKGIHHSYLGAWLIGFGTFFLYMNSGNSLDEFNIIYELCIGIGAFCLIDDTIEHKITADTPLRIIYEKIILRYIKK